MSSFPRTATHTAACLPAGCHRHLATSPNIFYLATGEIVYHAAAVGVVYNKAQHTQVGLPHRPFPQRQLTCAQRQSWARNPPAMLRPCGVACRSSFSWPAARVRTTPQLRLAKAYTRAVLQRFTIFVEAQGYAAHTCRTADGWGVGNGRRCLFARATLTSTTRHCTCSRSALAPPCSPAALLPGSRRRHPVHREWGPERGGW